MDNRGHVIAFLKSTIARFEDNARESYRVAPNSYGAGYDSGYLDALRNVRREIMVNDGAPLGRPSPE